MTASRMTPETALREIAARSDICHVRGHPVLLVEATSELVDYLAAIDADLEDREPEDREPEPDEDAEPVSDIRPTGFLHGRRDPDAPRIRKIGG